MSEHVILVINCGSSSLKFGLFRKQDLHCVTEGIAEALGGDNARLKYRFDDEDLLQELPGASHQQSLEMLLQLLEQRYQLSATLQGIGHRVVHGGELFSGSILITPEVKAQIESCVPLAPLHNPANLLGIQLLTQFFPHLPQVAVFDTAFHQSMPPEAYIYGLPYHLYEKHGVRRYGFHGTSHRYVTLEAARFLDKPRDQINLVTAHLGNGASVTAERNGQSVDTSMGMTPLEGLVMGTRCGDVDAGIFSFLIEQGETPESVNKMLNQQSGLLGISGVSQDMRTLCAQADQGNYRCQLAIDVFCARLAKYIAAMLSSLPHCDALVFTGGIGENAAVIREKTVARLGIFGYRLDSELNEHTDAEISIISRHLSPMILVIRTDEEKLIAQDTLNLIIGGTTEGNPQ